MSSWFQWFPSNGTVFLWVRTHNARLSLAKAPSSLPQSMMTPVNQSRMGSTNIQSKTSQITVMFIQCGVFLVWNDGFLSNSKRFISIETSMLRFFVQAIVGRIATNSELFRVGMRFFYVWFLRSQKMHEKTWDISGFLSYFITFDWFFLLALLGLLLWDPLQN